MSAKYKDLDDDIYDIDTFIDYTNIDIDDSEQKELEKQQIDCCVAYIDILGFKDMINNDSHLPVFALRFIKKFIDIFCRSTNQNYIDYNTDDEMDDGSLPKATMFSDSIVISQPIVELDYPLFIDLIAQLQYGLFTKGILIRGGISRGKLYHDENYLFGKGLINAYLLESKHADYPRIVVDKNLIEEIHKIVYERFEQSWKDSMLIDGKRYYYNNGLDDDEGDYSTYVCSDFDNQIYINYFSKIIENGFMEFDGYRSKITLQNLINNSEIINAKNIIEIGLKTKDHRILTKYEWLRKLYNRSMRNAFMARGLEKAKKTLNALLIG